MSFWLIYTFKLGSSLEKKDKNFSLHQTFDSRSFNLEILEYWPYLISLISIFPKIVSPFFPKYGQNQYIKFLKPLNSFPIQTCQKISVPWYYLRKYGIKNNVFNFISVNWNVILSYNEHADLYRLSHLIWFHRHNSGLVCVCLRNNECWLWKVKFSYGQWRLQH